MIKLRKVTSGEEKTALRFIEEAKKHLRYQGIDQWQDGYPDIESIRNDVAADRGYFITRSDIPIGYLCLDFEGESAYNQLNSWECIGNYAALHRMAIGDSARGMGAGLEAFLLCEKLCLERGVRSIRVDTKDTNPKMRHVIVKSGYEYRGDVYYSSCGDRMAFEKVF